MGVSMPTQKPIQEYNNKNWKRKVASVGEELFEEYLENTIIRIES